MGIAGGAQGNVARLRAVEGSVGFVLGIEVVEPVDLELRGQRLGVDEPGAHAAQLVEHHDGVGIPT